MMQKYIALYYQLLVSVSSRQMAPRKSDIVVLKKSGTVDCRLRNFY